MFRTALVTAVSFVLSGAAGAQPAFPKSLTPTQVANVALFGKVWGFVKYHHPLVTSGTKEIDTEVVRVLPELLAARTAAAGTTIIDRWVTSLGTVPRCVQCVRDIPQDSMVHLRPDNAWLGDERTLGKSLSSKLRDIHANRSNADKQQYIEHVPNVRNPTFKEDEYRDHRVPGEELRMVGLYRFWNIIAYWFPYRDLIEENWNGVLTEFVPKLWAASDSVSYRREMMALVARVHDTHANLWSSLDVRPPVGVHVLPVTVRFVGDTAVVDGYSNPALGAASGLKRGDVITHIDGARVDSLVRAWTPYYAASNHPTRLRDIGRNITKGAAGPVKLTVLRDGATMQVEATRVPYAQIDARASATHDLPGQAFQRLSDEVAYLKLSSVTVNDATDYIRKAEGAKVLVIDIRNYPSAFVVFALGRHLIGESTEFARFTQSYATNPGAFIFSRPLSLLPQEPRFKGKVVILIDEVSQSQAEYTTMAFRTSPGSLVVGSTTAAADGNVSPIPLPGGLRAMISGIGVFYPNKQPTQRVGIIPQLEVRPTIKGIKEGRDEVLEAGVTSALGKPFSLPPKG